MTIGASSAANAWRHPELTNTQGTAEKWIPQTVYNIRGHLQETLQEICAEVEKYSGIFHIVPWDFLFMRWSQSEKMNACPNFGGGAYTRCLLRLS